ncbi:hypothetical protein ALI144C_16980 [Actinosynnema sp. ALI-1.44]|uniref:hypothetical protein n=1 Tax=Actinosynnema sp. ALI-1.44 TaxID=1933779 RepID=UPI00097BDB06|nr:hypothetical protein [Actinosynnema sp. ALI-1.44]ONI83190.1 hypothetical protein ALI144C_16980 [Actinosynnema sp. ALI-1.44]
MSAPAVPTEVASVLRRYSELAGQVSEKYGPGSQAVVFVHYEELLAARSMLLTRREDATLLSRVDTLRTLIQRMYSASVPQVPGQMPSRLLRRDPPLIEYDRGHFEQRYAKVCDVVGADVIAGQRCRDPFGAIRPRTSYMFVVTDEAELRIWGRPFDLPDLMFGRNRATVRDVPVAHPMLVPERLRVSAAGEMVLLGSAKVEMVVANTKSGHFRPPPESAAVVRDVCREMWDLDDADIDVFTLFSHDSGQERH